jgi:hypothetical protein
MPDPIIPPQPASVQSQKDSKSSNKTQTAKTAGTSTTSPDMKALQGKTTIDEKVSIETEILAYSAITAIAEQIAREFHDKILKDQREKNATHNDYWIIVLDDSLVAALAAHQALVMELNLITDGFNRVINAGTQKVEKPTTRVAMFVPLMGVMEGLSAATTLGRSIVDVLSLFRQDTSYYGRSYTVKDAALVHEVAHHLCKDRNDVHCIYPKLLLYRPVTPEQKSHSGLRDRLQSTYELRDQAEQIVGTLSKSCLELGLRIHPPLPQQPPQDPELSELSSELVEKSILLDSCKKLFNAYDAKISETVTGLSKPDTKGVTPIEIIQKAEEILDRFQEHKAHTFFFYVEAVDAGGAYRVRSNLWRTLFNSDGLSYSGGAIVTFAFLDGNAELALCGTHRYRTPFMRFKDKKSSDVNLNSF